MKIFIYGCERYTSTDGIIYKGIENFFSKEYPSFQLLFLSENSRFYRDTTLLSDIELMADNKCDLIVVPGSPFLWDGYYSTPKIKNLLRAKEIHKCPTVWFGIGACFPEDNLEVVDKKFLEETVKIFGNDLVFVRDILAAEVMKKAGVAHKQLLCPSFFSTSRTTEKSGQFSVFYEPSIGLSRSEWHMERREKLYDVYRAFRDKFPSAEWFVKDHEEVNFCEHFVGVTPSVFSDRDDAISKLSKYEFGISGRVHCAVPALASGTFVSLIPIDSRHLTVTQYTDGIANIETGNVQLGEINQNLVDLHYRIYADRIYKFIGKNEPQNRKVGEEASKWYKEALINGFFDKYMSGSFGLDVGGVGYLEGTTTILPSAKMIDLNTPGYDGKTLPFSDESVDYIFSSHMLEHVPTENVSNVLKDWLRVLKTDKYIVVTVPHQFLYEKKKYKPSRYNEDHQRFYTCAKLAAEIEEALEPNSYRIEMLRDCDEGFNYCIPPCMHSCGRYEILCVIKKIKKPVWRIE